MAYTNSLELWKSLGKNSYHKVRAEAVGQGNGTTSAWSLDQDNLITDSTTFYDDAVEVTSSYTLDLDDGEVTGLTATAALTADYAWSDIPDSHIQEVLDRANEELTNSTGRSFAIGTSTEYINVEDAAQDEYYLSNWPVSAISSLQVNTSNITDTPNWESKTQGIGNDFIANDEDLAIGRIRWIDNFPNAKGKDKVKVVYVHGYATIPNMVKELETMMAQRQLINSQIYQTIIQGQDDSSPINIGVVEKRIDELTRKLKKINIEKP